MDLHHRLHRAKLLGESVREIGVLVMVFVPLDILLSSKEKMVPYTWANGCLSWLTPQLVAISFFTVLSISMLYWGIKMEMEATVRLELAEKGDNQDADSNGGV